MSWKRAKTPSKTVAGVDVYYITRRGQSEGGHDLVFRDGTTIRVLPDGTSGQRRSRVITQALNQALWSGLSDTADLVALVAGWLAIWGLTWEILQPERPLEDVVEAWMDGARDAAEFVAELDRAGWQIVRKETP